MIQRNVFHVWLVKWPAVITEMMGLPFFRPVSWSLAGREKRDYSAVVLKEEENLVIARPEGLEIRRIGAAAEEAGADQSKGDASAKPLLLREPCDLCSDREEGPLCLQFCPVNAISMD